jgi:hypothetical protein
LATSVIFEKLPKKENNRPLGENSPNLVTLIEMELHAEEHKNFS